MATPWLAILKRVPWSDVISNAPKVAEGAKKLWGSINRRASISPETTLENVVLEPGEAALRAELLAVKSAVIELQTEMLTSSELINEMAEQNAQLIRGIDGLRRRVFWLGFGILVQTMVFAGLVINHL